VSSVLGILVVFGSVIAGYLLAKGPLAVLWQPNELIVICGAAIGSVIISAPGRLLKRLGGRLKHALKPDIPKNSDYLDLLVLMHRMFQMMRRDGVLAMESHISEPEKSTLFQKHPTVLKRHHALTFLLEGVKQLVDGCPPDDVGQMLDTDIDTSHEEETQAIGLLRTTGDALPGLGIVAAVLGIIITMGHLDGGPEEIGHHVAAALVGTFLGILLCYGLVAPLAASLDAQATAESRYLQCIKAGLVAAARGSNASVALEFARRTIFPDERPSLKELEDAIKALKDAK
jgi:chemotaxis protein MotA